MGPLIPKNKKPPSQSQRASNAHFKAAHHSQNANVRRSVSGPRPSVPSSSSRSSSSFRNRGNDQFDRTSGKISDFRAEIDSLKAANRGTLSGPSRSDRSTDRLMSQIQHEHEEQE